MSGSKASELGLAVTTATGVVGVALGPVGGASLAAVQLPTDRRHAEELVPRIHEVMVGAGMTPSDLDVLVVDVGPGRFTGLRVGLATVRALAFALRIPVVGLTSLEILAAGWPGRIDAVDGGDVSQPSIITAVVDARRGEVFQQVFTVKPGPRPEVIPRGEPTVGPPDQLVAEAGGIVVGDGADHYRDVYRDHGLPVVTGRFPDGSVMLVLGASRRPRAGKEIEPVYLRDPDVNPNVKIRPRLVTTP